MSGDNLSQSSSLPPMAGPRVKFDRPCLAASGGCRSRKPTTLNIDTSLASSGKSGRGDAHNHPPFPRTPPPWLAKRRPSILPSPVLWRRQSRATATATATAQAEGGPPHDIRSRSSRIRSSVSAAFHRRPSTSLVLHGGRGKQEDVAEPRRPPGCGEEGRRRSEDEDYATVTLSLQSTISSAATAGSTDTAAQPQSSRPPWLRRWWT